MKELSIEEKAKAYDEALRYAMIYYKEGNEDMKMMMKTCFPALVEESEDERIRKEIINYFAKGKEYLSLCSIGKDDILAWLEKQVEKPSVIRWYNVSLIPQEMEELLVEWDSEDATWHEIAFYHADTKTFWNGTKQVENVTRWCYIIDLLEKQGESSDKIHYWTEEEIEPIISDYLRGAEHYGGMIGRLRCLKPKSLERQGDSPIKWDKNTEGNKPQVNHSVLMKTTHGIAEGEWKGEYWHQYRWAGIVRDSDVLSWMELSDLDKQGEQKPAWSIKEKLMLNDIIETTERSNIFKENYQRELIDWLKSLKNRYSWKPSDEQMDVLNEKMPRTDEEMPNEEMINEEMLKNDEEMLKAAICLIKGVNNDTCHGGFACNGIHKDDVINWLEDLLACY